MDPLTHALASYSLKRATFPRLPRSATLAIVIAGTVADLDSFSSSFGPSVYLAFHWTYFHSIAAAMLFSLVVSLPFLIVKAKNAEKQVSFAIIFIGAFLAGILHLAMDFCQSTGVELFWPFSARRFALDWVAHADLWILAIFLAGVLLPLLSGLVTEEIGSRSKAPRGRLGASIAFAALFLYLVVRFVYHGNAIAALESRTYRGENPRRVAAFAEPGTPFLWHGVVETDRALHDVEVPVGPGTEFDPGSAISSFKPEPSPVLDAARDSTVGRRFLQLARFPKASVEKTPEGFHVILRDFPYSRDATSGWRVQALIDADPSGKVLSQEFAWVPMSREFWWR